MPTFLFLIKFSFLQVEYVSLELKANFSNEL